MNVYRFINKAFLARIRAMVASEKPMTAIELPLYTELPRVDGKLTITHVTDEELERRYEKIRPLAFKKEKLRWIDRPKNLRTIAHLWDPQYLHKAKGLAPVFKFRTLHTWAYYGFFKPTVAEVLEQIPEEWLGKVCGFTITEGPEDVDDLNTQKEALNAGFHVATTTLYATAP